jgi:demethylmenaquinone methyltransferase/2-methoxy-6-polyprenyl-1,4-benzoquinol methylase
LQTHDVRGLFDSIAHQYDFLNHLLSGGIDLTWRRRAIERLRDLRPSRILDVATGTADFALAAMRLQPDQVVGVDIAERMLEVGRAKVARRGFEGRIKLEAGPAEHLRFADGSFDTCMVAFGARNFADLREGLREMHRVLRTRGRILVLEFSRPTAFPFRQIYLFYFRHILPHIGKLVSGSDHAYRYLPDTVMRFPDGDEFLGILREIGFSSVREERLTFGIVTIYTGER